MSFSLFGDEVFGVSQGLAPAKSSSASKTLRKFSEMSCPRAWRMVPPFKSIKLYVGIRNIIAKFVVSKIRRPLLRLVRQITPKLSAWYVGCVAVLHGRYKFRTQ